MSHIIPAPRTLPRADGQHPSWCNVADHALTGSPVHASALVELPAGLAGWLAQTPGAPVTFQLLDGPEMDADTLRALAHRLLEVASAVTP